jgi:ABC-type polysaccharide/polyol phosphate export permease
MSAITYDSTRQREVTRVVRDLIRHRELLRDLVWKDIRVRYRYAAIGFLWAVLQPVAFMLILTFVFSFVMPDKAALAGPTGAAPFPVFLLCGLIFWQCFADSVNAATQSLLDNRNLVNKVCFAREIIPVASTGYPVVNLGIGFVVLLGVHLGFGGGLHLALLYFPPLFAIQYLLTVGLALLLSCGNALYRDVGYAANVAVMFGFYASPVFYPLALVSRLPEWAQFLYRLNPMAGLLTAYRQILFEARFPDLALLAWPLCAACIAAALGATIFRRNAPTLSDYL